MKHIYLITWLVHLTQGGQKLHLGSRAAGALKFGDELKKLVGGRLRPLKLSK